MQTELPYRCRRFSQIAKKVIFRQYTLNPNLLVDGPALRPTLRDLLDRLGHQINPWVAVVPAVFRVALLLLDRLPTAIAKVPAAAQILPPPVQAQTPWVW